MDLYLIFDGGNGASVEKEAYGSWIIKNTKDTENGVKRRVVFGTGYTNNEAEYKTLTHALEYIIDQYTATNIELHISGDSELVRNQIGTYVHATHDQYMNGSPSIIWIDVWQVKKKHLLPLRNKARELLRQFKGFTYNHMPRKEVVAILGH